MDKVAFYLMNTKGKYVLERFIQSFGVEKIAYLVSEKDVNVQDDPYYKIKSLAQDCGITFYTRKEFPIEEEKSFAGYKFAIGWRWMINDIENLIIFHDSILPKYRGFAPLVNSLINGEEKVGVTALLADVSYDMGKIIGQKSVSFSYPMKAKQIIDLIEPLYFELIEEVYISLAKDLPITAVEQNHSEATYSLWLDEQDYFIDWAWDAHKIKRFIDATGYPYDGAKTKINEQIYRVLEAKVIDDVVIENRQRHLGKIIFMQDDPVVVCGEGLIKLVQYECLDGRAVLFNFRSKFD